ncbi:MAG: hypothetical protein IPK16_15930 [Anaerolineales bacterium]|nr:hypothetical protein [Anaerolineales bacterium]
MVRDTAILLRLYWRMDRRDGSGMPLVVNIFSVVLAIAGAVFSGFFGFAAGMVVTYSRAPVQIEEGVAPGAVLTLLFVSLLFAGFNQALRALFLSGDLERLLVAPINLRAVMTAKLLSRLPSTVLIMFILTVPALIAYGIVMDMGPFYYLAGAMVVAGAPLFSMAIGAIIAILLVLIFPVQRLNEYVSAVYILIGATVAFGIQLVSAFMRGDRHNSEPGIAASELLAALQRAPLPTLWAGHGMTSLGRGNWTTGGSELLGYLLITFGLFAVVVLLGDRLYLKGWLRMQASGVRKRGLDRGGGLLASGSLDNIIALKDWLLRIRDSRQMATLLGQMLGAVVIAFLFLRPRPDRINMLPLPALIDANALWWLQLPSPGVLAAGWILLIGWMIFSQTAATSLALEGASFYILKAAPVSARQVLRAKTVSILIPYAIVATGLLIASWVVLQYDLLWTPYAWCCLLLMGSGMLGFTTAMGFPWVNLKWEDPRRMNRGAVVFMG